MSEIEALAQKVRTVDPNCVELPVLRDLIVKVQTRSADEVRKEGQSWTDTNWSQWKEHGSHNPW